jgi:hypothetical protein
VGIAAAAGGLTAALVTGGAQPVAQASTSPGGSNAGVASLQRLCDGSASAVGAGNATGFETYANQQCRSKGVDGLAAELNSPVAVGVLSCNYVKMLTANGSATLSQQAVAASCGAPAVPQVTGIQPAGIDTPAILNIHATNLWFGTVGGNPTTVYAGTDASTATPTQAGPIGASEVSVLVSPLGEPSAITVDTSPTADGALTIQSAAGDVLRLTAADGAVYTFDIARQALSKTSS